jgi:Bacteriophage head to tail connecting protein
MDTPKVKLLKDRYTQLKAEKAPWLALYQTVGEYVRVREQNFTGANLNGQFVTDKVFDNTGIKANTLLASAMIGALWPNGARTFRITRPDNMVETNEIKDWFDYVTRTMVKYMDDSHSGLRLALQEYMSDQGSFGTAGLAVLENDDPKKPILFRAWNVKGMVIDEGPDGFVDTVYNLRSMTLRQALQEYGYETLSSESRKRIDAGLLQEKVEILHCIEPRIARNPHGFGVLNMPIASIHIEYSTGKILKESGFDEMPILVARFSKATDEIYGRSPAMDAMPDIIELNALWEAVMIASEKQLDPPLAVANNSVTGNGVVDTSAGGMNVIDTNGLGNVKDIIIPLYTVGEFNSVYKIIEKLEASISQAFMIDRLLDFNNETRMTAYETSVRNQLRGESIGSVFARQEAELFTPLIERTFNLLFRRGYFGVLQGSTQEQMLLAQNRVPRYIPDAIVNTINQDEEVFKIGYISPAKRIMQAEELQGLMTSVQFVTQAAAIDPNSRDALDMDMAVWKVAELSGTPTEIMNSEEDMAVIRQARAKQNEAVAQAENARNQSEIMRNVAQAQATAQNAQNAPGIGKPA